MLLGIFKSNILSLKMNRSLPSYSIIAGEMRCATMPHSVTSSEMMTSSRSGLPDGKVWSLPFLWLCRGRGQVGANQGKEGTTFCIKAYRSIAELQSVFSALLQGLDDDILQSSIGRWAVTAATYCPTGLPYWTEDRRTGGCRQVDHGRRQW